MLELNFPPYAIHKHAHDEYLADFDALLDAWRKSSDVLPVADFLKHSTPDWMRQHIGSMDFVTANFFHMCESG